MNELVFKRTIIIFSILGLFLLIVYSLLFVPKAISISSIQDQKEGGIINVVGIIKDVSSKDNIIRFNICENTSCVSCVLFNANKNQYALINQYSLSKSEGRVSGQYKIYMNSPEVIVYNVD